jgi:hypothetical protein
VSSVFRSHSLLGVLVALAACDSIKHPNTPVPDTFHAMTLTDDPLDRSALEGRPWVISVWRPGCNACMRQLKAIDAVKQRLQMPVLGFVALSLDTDEDAVLEAASRAEVDSALAIAVGETMGPLGLRQLPSTVFIDAKGVIVASCNGECDETAIEKWARVAAP